MLDKKDMRVKITKKLVYDAMLGLMLRRRFKEITVNELCERAQISRATFYVHFEDKYYLLKSWLTILLTNVHTEVTDFDYLYKEKYINKFVYENKRVIENLLIDADSETIDIVFEVMYSFSNISTEKLHEMNAEHVVLSNIYVGGLISYLTWHARNRFPKDVPLLNEFLYTIVKNYL